MESLNAKDGADRIAKGTVLFNRRPTDEQISMVRDAAPEVETVWAETPGEFTTLIERAEVLFWAYGGVRLGPEDLSRAERLRWVHVGMAGVDHVLFPELVRSDVVVTNSSDALAENVAEHALALMLAFAHNIHVFERHRAARRWDRVKTVGLAGLTLGVVGLGNIGVEAAKRAKAFGMKVIGIRRNPAPSPWADEVMGPESLPDLLSRSDFVLLSVPLTPLTRRLIGKRELDAMKRTACLVNVSRGQVIDEAALIEALRSGRLGGAALDVFEREPLPPDSPIWELENLVFTPHIAGSTGEHIRLVTRSFCDNLRRWVAGKPLEHVVDKQAGY